MKRFINLEIIIYGVNTTHHIQEEFRHIKRKLLNNAFGVAAKTLNNSNLIMVTSTNPNEGKTYVSINLALSIALEQDKTVLSYKTLKTDTHICSLYMYFFLLNTYFTSCHIVGSMATKKNNIRCCVCYRKRVAFDKVNALRIISNDIEPDV